MLVKMFKMTFSTKHFNSNQKVWVLNLSGNQSAQVVGKFRGKRKYVRVWISWDGKDKIAPEIKEIDIDDTFASRLGVGEVNGNTK